MKVIILTLLLLATVVVTSAEAWWERDYRYDRHHYRYDRYERDYRYHNRYGDHGRQRYYCCNEDRYEVGRERPRQTFWLKKPDGTTIETVR